MGLVSSRDQIGYSADLSAELCHRLSCHGLEVFWYPGFNLFLPVQIPGGRHE